MAYAMHGVAQLPSVLEIVLEDKSQSHISVISKLLQYLLDPNRDEYSFQKQHRVGIGRCGRCYAALAGRHGPWLRKLDHWCKQKNGQERV